MKASGLNINLIINDVKSFSMCRKHLHPETMPWRGKSMCVCFHWHSLFSQVVFSSSVASSVQVAHRASAIWAAIVNHSVTPLVLWAREQSRPKLVLLLRAPMLLGPSPTSLHAASIFWKHFLTTFVRIFRGLQNP